MLRSLIALSLVLPALFLEQHSFLCLFFLFESLFLIFFLSFYILLNKLMYYNMA